MLHSRAVGLGPRLNAHQVGFYERFRLESQTRVQVHILAGLVFRAEQLTALILVQERLTLPRRGRSTIRRILKAAGLPPVPQRPTSRPTFLKAHWGSIAGADFFTTEVWTW